MGFKDTLKHFKNYFGATIATKALTLISVPVLTRLMGVTPYDYGIIALFTTYVSIFIVLVTLNTYVGTGRRYYEGKGDFKEYFGTTVNLNILLFIPTSVIALLFTNQFSTWLGISPLIYILMICTVATMIASSLYSQIFAARQESKKVAKYSMATAYVGFILTVLFTYFNPAHKYLGSIYAQFITGFIFLFYIIYALKPFYKFAFRKEHIRYMLHYSVPLIPYFLSSIILGQFDRVMIAKYTNASNAGLYSFAYNIGMILALIMSALNMAWIPKYYTFFNEQNYKEYDSQVDYMNRIMLTAALGLIFFGKELGMILGSNSYHASLHLVPVIVIGYLFFFYFYIWQWNIDYAKKTIYSSLVITFSGAMNVLFNIIFIPKYGYESAAYTTTVSYFIMALLAWSVNYFVLKKHAYPVKKIAALFIGFIPFVIFYFLLEQITNNFWSVLSIKFILLLLYIFICFKKDILLLINKNK